MDRAMELDRTAAATALTDTCRKPGGKGREPNDLIGSDPVIQTNAPPTLDGLFRRILARQPEALALVDPPDKLRVTGQPPQAPDLRAGRPRHLGAGGPFHRSRPAGQFGDRGSAAQHRRIHADGAGGASRRPGRGAVAAAVAPGRTDRCDEPHGRARHRDHRAGSTGSTTPISP